MDIESFFPSVKAGAIYSVFFELGYTKQLSALLSKLCCLNGQLPQGAPTSPTLANLVLRPVDEVLLAYCLSNDLRYTRYADDLVVSGAKVSVQALATIRKTLRAAGFDLNERKTRLMRDGSRKIITGIVVNDKMHVPRELRRKFRQTVYYIRKFGLDGHVRFTKERRSSYLDHLIGIGSFITWLNQDDKGIFKELEYLRRLKREYFDPAGAHLLDI